MTTWGREIGGAAAAQPRRGDGTREGWREGWKEGSLEGGGLSPGPQAVLGVQAGTGTRLQLCLPCPACRSGSGAGAQPRALLGGPHCISQAWRVPPVSPAGWQSPSWPGKTRAWLGWELGKWLQAGSSVFTGAQEFACRDNQLSPQALAHYNNIKIKWDIGTAVLKLLKGSEQM